MGGGIVSVTTDRIKWSDRFLVLGNGMHAAASTTGHHNIPMPAAGTNIANTAGGTNAVDVNGIYLPDWNALWYVLPVGQNESAGQAANLRMGVYSSIGEVPDNWVLIAVRNGDTSQGPFVKLGDGRMIRAGASSSPANPYQQYALTSHNHNDLYYTEAEVDAKLAAGYPLAITQNAVNLYAGQWTRLGTFRLTGQYTDATLTGEITSHGDGYGYTSTARIVARVKQQSPLGQAPLCTVYVGDTTGPLVASDFRLTTTTMSATETVATLWVRNPQGWTTLRLIASSQSVSGGTFTGINNDAYTTTVPVELGYVAGVDIARTPTAHSHNDLYYTKAEVDAKTSGSTGGGSGGGDTNFTLMGGM
jgi:hypothetical protein